MYKFKRLLLIMLLVLFTMSLTGCAGKTPNLVNPTGELNELGARNINVIKDLYAQGLISKSQCDNYEKAINIKILEYTSLMDSVLNPPDTITKKELTEIKNNALKIKNMLMGAVSGRFGFQTSDNITGITTVTCDESGQYLALKDDTDYKVIDKDEFQYLISGETDSMMNPKSMIEPLTLIDESMTKTLLDELNREVYVLNPNTVNADNWLEVLEMIDNIKNDTIPDEAKYTALVQKYFVNLGVHAFNFTHDDLVISSTYNDSIGKEKVENMINKDFVLTGTINVGKHEHYTNEDGSIECVFEPTTKNIGVYSLRVEEFNNDFRNLVSEEYCTNDKYIRLNLSSVNKVGGLLLMEYPVAIISSLTSDSSTSPNWNFEFQETEMKINIYNGEMLMLDSNGDYQKINTGDEAIYNIFGKNIGLNTENGKSVSFVPMGETLAGIEDVTSQVTNYDKVKLLKIKNAVTEEKSLDYGIKLNTAYPFKYLYRNDYSCKISGDYYEFSKHNGNELLKLKGTKFSYMNNSTTYNDVGNIKTWDDLWKLFDKYYNKINDNNIKAKEEYSIYKLYNALKNNGKLTDSDPVNEWFSSAVIYNSLYIHFGEKFNSLESDYDKKFTLMRQTINSFDYNMPDEHGINMSGTYSSLSKLANWNDNKVDEVFNDIKSLGDNYLNLYNTILSVDEQSVGCAYILCDLLIFTGFEEDENIDPFIGLEITLNDFNRENLKFNTSEQLWEFSYLGNVYYCTPLVKKAEDLIGNGFVNDLGQFTVVQFALKEYLELTYMPNIVDGENFIATGRRIKIEKFSGSGDEEIGYYADKMGDPIKLTDDGEILSIKVSDIVDYSSGFDDYYDGIAKSLSFNGKVNEAKIENEISNRSLESLKSLFTGVSLDDEEDTGMTGDKHLLSYTLYQKKILPVLKFTSDASDSKPSLDAIDVNNSSIDPALYYGICVNTNGYKSGLYTKWIDYKDDTGKIGNLEWWNSWLSSHNYDYHIDIDKLKNAMSGLYTASLAEMDETIVFNSNTLKVINKEMVEEKYVKTTSIVRTLEVLLGVIFLIYGLMMMSCWLIDVNLVNGPGLLTIITFGHFVSIRDASEIPRMSDGKVYTDFKYLLVVTVLLMILGIILIVFDIQIIWEVVTNLFSGIIDLFKDLMLNR